MSSHNQWLQSYLPVILEYQKKMQVCHLKGSYGLEINLMSISSLLNGACDEITKLQNKVNNLEIELEKAKHFGFFDDINAEKVDPEDQ